MALHKPRDIIEVYGALCRVELSEATGPCYCTPCSYYLAQETECKFIDELIPVKDEGGVIGIDCMQFIGSKAVLKELDPMEVLIEEIEELNKCTE